MSFSSQFTSDPLVIFNRKIHFLSLLIRFFSNFFLFHKWNIRFVISLDRSLGRLLHHPTSKKKSSLRISASKRKSAFFSLHLPPYNLISKVHSGYPNSKDFLKPIREELLQRHQLLSKPIRCHFKLWCYSTFLYLQMAWT